MKTMEYACSMGIIRGRLLTKPVWFTMYLCYSTYEKQFVYSGIMSEHFGKFWEVKLSLLALTSHFDHFFSWCHTNVPYSSFTFISLFCLPSRCRLKAYTIMGSATLTNVPDDGVRDSQALIWF